MDKKTPAFMIAGTSSGVGKTTVAMGIMAALSKRMAVQSYKVGPDYIDPAFHSFITGRVCRNLDSYMMASPMIRYLFRKNMEKADVGVVEGVMGLFDGAEIGSDIGTSASIAKILGLPVILVVDGAKVAASLAAVVKGFDSFDPELRIAGVIINNVGSEQHYELLKRGIEYHTEVKVFGYLLKNRKLILPERHLGLVPACEQGDLEKVFDTLAAEVAKTIDLDGLLINAAFVVSDDLDPDIYQPDVFNTTPLRIGIAKDKAFNFYYQDGLDYLETYGKVTWVPFSPMEDSHLPPDLDGLYFGGGFPEVFPTQLKANETFVEELLRQLGLGIPYTAECGGLMYLCQELIDFEGNSHKMVGWLPGKTAMTKRLQRFGYADLTLKEPCVFGPAGGQIKIHEFHRSGASVDMSTIYHIQKERGGELLTSWECGYKKGNGVAAYAHMHFMSNPGFGKAFVASCLAYKNQKIK